MSLTIYCVDCAHPYELDPSMVGKQVRCKVCKTVFRVPAPAPPPRVAPPRAQARVQPPPLPPPVITPSRPRDDYAEPVVLPKRVGFESEPDEWSRSRSTSEDDLDPGGKWRTRGIGFGMLGIIFYQMPKFGLVLAYRGKGIDPSVQIVLGALLAAIGVLIVGFAVLIAIVSRIRDSDNVDVSSGAASLWIFSVLMSCVILFAGVQIYFPSMPRPTVVRNPQVPQPQPRPTPVPRARNPRVNPTPAGPVADASPAINPSQDSPTSANVRVVLSNGRVGPFANSVGRVLPGIVYRADYVIENRQVLPERYYLVIKTRDGPIRLVTSFTKNSGTFSGLNLAGRMDDGPFEAWMEVESVVGKVSRTISDTIELQTTGPGPAYRPNETPAVPTGSVVTRPRRL